MKMIALALIFAISLLDSAACAFDDCIKDNKFIYHENNQLVRTSTFLPAGATTDFILKAPFSAKATYFVKFDAHYLDAPPSGGQDYISVAQMPENSPYVKSGLANKSDSLARVQVPPALSNHWQTVRVRIYGCESNTGSPPINSHLDMKASSTEWSASIVIVSVMVLYLAATLAFRTLPIQKDAMGMDAYSRYRYLDPVVLTAGLDGKGSLAKLQILFFSVIVFGLLFYILLRTGELSDLSETVLLLLGIAAVGSTAAKGADQRNRLDFENYAWLVNKGWLGEQGLAKNNRARWRDIVTSDGEFDVYRYQSCIFSLVVGGALVVVGVNQLASFQIPSTLLGVLGLSQIVYVAGKLVSPPAFSDLNKSISALIGLEKNLRDARAKLQANASLTDDAIKSDYEKYLSAAKTTAIMFKSVTGLDPPDDLAPSVT